ncbi:hypothetical protein HA402_013533 [Bradysia odoriphaga]|nr:hypothetical protein HA402_013533 [Bradysia odoriphaga]
MNESRESDVISDTDSSIDYTTENETVCDTDDSISCDTEIDSDSCDTNCSCFDSSFDTDHTNGLYTDSDFDTTDDSDMDIESENDPTDDLTDFSEMCDDNMSFRTTSSEIDLDEYLQQDRATENIFTPNVSQEETRQFLRNWVLQENINHQPMNLLLRFLKRTWPGLCIDVRTLMKTPTTREVIPLHPGKYVYLGMESSVDLLLSTIDVALLPNRLMLTFMIDGVPLAKSSNNGFWLILGRIENIPILRKHIFVVDVYYGDKKPRSFNDFLEPFVREFIRLQYTYEHRGQVISLRIHSIVCDGPAKADVKYIKHPTGFYACDKCQVKGVKVNNRMCFANMNECLRDNRSFRDAINEEHHKGEPIIEDINELDMVDDFPLDPLHVIYLGVVKRMLRIWLFGDEDSALDDASIKEISDSLKLIGMSQPKEFQRKCRELSNIGYFKGHEFRTFLLYSAPVVLRNILPYDKYNHFLLLHTAITILNRIEMCQKYNRLAEILLRDFVEGVAEHYGVWNVVLCVHSLIHIPKDVQKYGNLNEYGAFPFESHMYQIKRQIKKHNTQQSELCNRIEEKKLANFVKVPKVIVFPLLKKPKMIDRRTKVFCEIVTESFTLKNSEGNNWFMTKQLEIVRFEYLQSINEIWCVYGFERRIKSDFYTIPIQSSKLNIFKVFNKREEIGKMYSINEIAAKLFCISFEENYDVFFPLNHSLEH